MKFPKYWVKVRLSKEEAGLEFSPNCWGWSDHGEEEARRMAGENARRVAEALRKRGGEPPHAYGYFDRPMREEVVRQAGEPGHRAVVSRNSYGCLVLNAESAAFIDVDDHGELTTPVFSRLLSLLKGEGDLEKGRDDQMRAKVERWLAGGDGRGMRVYRTAKGWRLLVTHTPVNPQGGEIGADFDFFGADPLYRRLCAAQRCFRARLTPKPWRCDLRAAPCRWPWASAEEEGRFREWERQYLEEIRSWRTCRLLGQYGREEIHEALRPVVELHDAATRCASEDLPLA